MLRRINNILNMKSVRLMYLIFLLFIISACILPLESRLTHAVSEYTVLYMIGLLILGLVFFILNHRHLMISSMISCAVLCIYLKDASNNNLLIPKIHKGPKLTVMHINVASAERQYEQVFDLIESNQADIVTIQESTPDWQQYFSQTMDQIYPYQAIIDKPISFGSGIYSRYPIDHIDTIIVERIPNLSVAIHTSNNTEVHIVNTYLMANTSTGTKRSAKDRLSTFTAHINQITKPIINLGDFNMTYWSREILNYRLKSGLENSRRGVNVTRLEVPYDHIFFSQELECIALRDLEVSDNIHIGLLGTFQLRAIPEKKKEEYSSTILRF